MHLGTLLVWGLVNVSGSGVLSWEFFLVAGMGPGLSVFGGTEKWQHQSMQ